MNSGLPKGVKHINEIVIDIRPWLARGKSNVEPSSGSQLCIKEVEEKSFDSAPKAPKCRYKKRGRVNETKLNEFRDIFLRHGKDEKKAPPVEETGASTAITQRTPLTRFTEVGGEPIFDLSA